MTDWQTAATRQQKVEREKANKHRFVHTSALLSVISVIRQTLAMSLETESGEKEQLLSADLSQFETRRQAERRCASSEQRSERVKE